MVMSPLQRQFIGVCCLVAATATPAPCRSEVVDLTLPRLSGQRHLYFVGLLDTVLRHAGHTPNITLVGELPQNRVWTDTESGVLTLFWSLPSAERDARFIPIGHDLTGGMMGMRLILTRPSNLPVFATVRTVEDLRATKQVVGFGKGWIDIDIWKKNSLPFHIKTANWTEMFKMVADGRFGIDYLSRSVLEISEEFKQNKPGLVIEPNLMLVYNLDMKFYLSRHSARLQPLLERALSDAARSGLINEFSQRYYKKLSQSLALNARRKVYLQIPTQEVKPGASNTSSELKAEQGEDVIPLPRSVLAFARETPW
jgi:hypothetical protein